MPNCWCSGPWAFEVGRISGSTVYDEALPKKVRYRYAKRLQLYVQRICERQGLRFDDGRFRCCLDNPYKPTLENGNYELSDEFANQLWNAAYSVNA